MRRVFIVPGLVFWLIAEAAVFGLSLCKLAAGHEDWRLRLDFA
jgi:hypothetical protein